MGKFITELRAKKLPNKDGRKQWQLLSDLVYKSRSMGLIIAPEKTITDFSSVPRFPIIFWLFGDRGDEEGTLHDVLYSPPHTTGTVTIVANGDGSLTVTATVVDRATADSVLRGARYACCRIDMEEFEDVTVRALAHNIWAYIGAWCFWAAVRVVGWRYWRK